MVGYSWCGRHIWETKPCEAGALLGGVGSLNVSLVGRRQVLITCAILSVVTSLSMLLIVVFRPQFPVWALFALNWLLFACVNLLALRGRETVGGKRRLNRADHNIWRITLLAFSGCALAAFAMGARIV